ncbi:hypothetical protein MMC26_003079 [Xylographa opegraphella]|nr:hypothetical protein [Xylographa opegraphella]
MSGFLSSEAEKALMGDAANAERLFNDHLLVDDNSHWTHAHTAPNGLDYFHPEPSRSPALGIPGPSGSSTSLTPSAMPSRSTSPHTHDLNNYGFLNSDQRSWRCAYPGCASKAVFVRPCDLRKHFNRHSKSYHCRYDGCAQATEGGFSSKKDRARHEAKHNPGVPCEWEGCERIFSRRDNMLDHVRRIHRKGA